MAMVYLYCCSTINKALLSASILKIKTKYNAERTTHTTSIGKHDITLTNSRNHPQAAPSPSKYQLKTTQSICVVRLIPFDEHLEPPVI